MEKVIVRRQQRQPSKEANASLHPVLNRVIHQRSCSYTDHALCDLESPFQLKNIKHVTQRICQAINLNSPILVVGDYDCDGATATAVAVQGLKLLGHRSVDYLIPNRFKSGYGLSKDIVDQALQKPKKPKMIITVDNGISSIDGVKYAQKNDIEVVITDHHLPGEQLPPTESIINPQLAGDQFASKAICGVGVIYYVLLAVRKQQVENGKFTATTQPNFMDLIDLVTIGTIADCVPLDKNNRIIIAHGLRRIRNNQMSHGIRAMIEQSELCKETITATDIAFKIAPKLNAAGRMDDMAIGVKCLLSQDMSAAAHLAKSLFVFNDQRRDVQESMQLQAQMQAKTSLSNKGVVLYDQSWHQGVIGITASRVKDLFYRPVIVFTDDQDSLIKGSGRSIDGIHLRDILARISESSNILTKFGGHAMAAGLTIHKDDLPEFRERFNKEVSRYDEATFTPTLLSDGPLSEKELNMQTAVALRDYGIWGNSYPEPVFENIMRVHSKRIIKGKHLRMDLELGDSLRVESIWFYAPERMITAIQVGVNAQFFYKLNINTYLGESRCTLLVEHVVIDVQ